MILFQHLFVSGGAALRTARGPDAKLRGCAVATIDTLLRRARLAARALSHRERQAGASTNSRKLARAGTSASGRIAFSCGYRHFSTSWQLSCCSVLGPSAARSRCRINSACWLLAVLSKGLSLRCLQSQTTTRRSILSSSRRGDAFSTEGMPPAAPSTHAAPWSHSADGTFPCRHHAR